MIDSARIPVEVEYASEFRYRNPMVGKGDVVIAISQSGETADTLAALREAKRQGVLVLGIVNVVGSTIAREPTPGSIFTPARRLALHRREAFTSELVALALITLKLARIADAFRSLKDAHRARA